MELRINPLTLKLENYDKSHYCCSVCQQYYPVESYCRDGIGPRYRTNCEACFNLPVAEWDVIKQKLDENVKSSEYYNLDYELSAYLRYRSCGVNAHEFANRLLQLPKNSEIYAVVYYDGYSEMTTPFSPLIDTDLLSNSLLEFIKTNNLEELPPLYQII